MPVPSFSWCPFLELLFVYCMIFYQEKKNKTEIQFHENAVAVCPGGQGEERVKSSSIYLMHRYILQVLLYSDLLSSAFFSFTLAFIAEGNGGWGGVRRLEAEVDLTVYQTCWFQK